LTQSENSTLTALLADTTYSPNRGMGKMGKQSKRLRRQFEALARGMPVTRQPIERLLDHRMRLLRVPAALLLMIGGLFSVLPVLGLWMLPLGLMLLAVDVPQIQPAVSNTMIRVRRQVARWRRGSGNSTS
jgi:hypothetical protein